MAQDIISQFRRAYPLPIETSRQVADITARNNISSGIRWQGMLVYVVADELTYILRSGVANEDWDLFSGIGDAPSDGNEYVRKNGGWEVITGGAVLSAEDIDTLAELNAIVTDATLIDTADARLSDARTPLAHTHTTSEITDLSIYTGFDARYYTETEIDSQSANYELIANKGAANGYAPLNGSSLIDASYLPSYVDDVLEYANFAAFPVTGEIGKIYIDIALNELWRWSGTVYVQVGGTGAVTWGAITGTLSNQTDLQSALDGKTDTGHTHTAANITDFDTEVSNNTAVSLNTAKTSFPGFTSLLADYSFTDNSTNWNTAFGWGDHSLAGYLTSETDSQTLTWTDGTNNLAISGGNSVTITGFANTSHTHLIADITDFTDNSTNWNTAFTWGDHALAGYLTSFTETNDLTASVTWANIPIANVPTGTTGVTVALGNHLHTGVYEQVDATIVRSTDLGYNNTDWDTAFGWGNHATQGYLTTETDNQTLTWTDGTNNLAISGGNSVTITGFADSVHTHLIANVTDFTDNSTNWNTAFGWGNHALAGYLTSETDNQTLTWTDGTNNLAISGGNNVTITGFANTSHTHLVSDITDFTDNSGNWDTAFGWGDHATQGYLTSETDSQTLTWTDGTNLLAISGGNSVTITGFADSTHTHTTTDITNLSSYTGLDSRYFTETESDARYVQSITVGTGLDVTGTGTRSITLDLSEFTDMTATMVGTDEFIVLDASAERRKAANEIGLSIFNNDSGFITSFDNDYVDTLSFSTGTGILTLGRTSPLGDLTVDLDGRYLTSETDSQTLSWTDATNLLAISGGNSVTITGFANTSHTHTTSDITNLSSYTGLDGRYYTETETDTLLNAKGSLAGVNSWTNSNTFSTTTFTAQAEFNTYNIYNETSSNISAQANKASFSLRSGTGSDWGFGKVNSSFYFMLDVDDITATRRGTIQNSDGTFAWLSDIPSLTGYATLGANAYTGGQQMPWMRTSATLPSNGNDVFTSTGATINGSIVMGSNTTSSTNYAGEFGQGVYFKGATTARDFAFWRNNSDNANGMYVGHKNGTSWVWNKLWHAGNDGIGSGLDADKLDGLDRSSSGNRFNVITYVASDGVMEVGSIIDFHNTDGDTGDNTYGRITGGTVAMQINRGLTLSGNLTAENEVDLTGTSPRIDFHETGYSTNWNIVCDADQFDVRRNGTATNHMRMFPSGFTQLYNRLTVSGNAVPIIAQGTGTGISSQNYWLARDSAGANLWYIGMASGATNDVLVHNYTGNNYMKLDDSGGENGLIYYTGANTRTVWHSGNLDDGLLSKRAFYTNSWTTGNIGKWTKIANVSTGAFQSRSASFTVVGTGHTDSDGEPYTQKIYIHVKQQSGAGNNPYLKIRTYYKSKAGFDVGYVITNNNPLPSTVDFYIQGNINYTSYYGFIDSIDQNTTGWTFYDLQSLVTTPSGIVETQAIREYNSANLQQTGSTSGSLIGQTSGTFSTTTNDVEWVQIGQLVYFAIDLRGISGTTPSGDIVYDMTGVGAPAAVSSGAYIYPVRSSGGNQNFYSMNAVLEGAGFKFQIQPSLDASNTSYLINTNFTSGTLQWNGVYLTA